MSKPTGRRRDSPRWDRTGEKYGRLTITGYAGFDDRNKKHLWWVRCSCPRHRVFMVPAINMTSGRTRGCGCLAGADRIINRIGDTFGRLTVIGRGQTSPTTGIRWICMCTCGNVSEVDSSNLQHGNTKSCGCLRREVAGQHRKFATQSIAQPESTSP